jgi:hypothetical protein
MQVCHHISVIRPGVIMLTVNIISVMATGGACQGKNGLAYWAVKKLYAIGPR